MSVSTFYRFNNLGGGVTGESQDEKKMHGVGVEWACGGRERVAMKWLGWLERRPLPLYL